MVHPSVREADTLHRYAGWAADPEKLYPGIKKPGSRPERWRLSSGMPGQRPNTARQIRGHAVGVRLVHDETDLPGSRLIDRRVLDDTDKRFPEGYILVIDTG
ncbi:MAG: hypothetical protein KKD39_01555 [Candidatus Altiarchaeota archaeon]|nr:hypothetical protein [Candidatus Altiarchaeota archaeon]